MENWRSYVAQEAMVSIPVTNVGDTNIFLLEGKEVKQITFGRLMEQHNSGELSSDEFVRLWEQSMDYEYNLLLQEGVLDLAKKGFAAVKAKGAEIVGKLSDTIKKAMAKVIAFVKKSFKQALDVLDGTFVKAQIAMKSLKDTTGKIAKDANTSPTLVKAAKVLTYAVGIYALYSIMGPAGAEASVVDAAGQVISGDEVNTALGYMTDTLSGAREMGDKFDLMSGLAELKEAHESTGQIPLDKLSNEAQNTFLQLADINEELEAVQELTVQKYDAGDTETAETLLEMADGMKKQIEEWRQIGASTQIDTTTRGNVGI